MSSPGDTPAGSGPPPGVPTGGGPQPGVGGEPGGGFGGAGAMLGLPITALQVQSARTYVAVIAPIFAIATLLFMARIVSRWRTRGIHADDYVLTLATALGIIEMSLTIAIVQPNLATPPPQFLAFAELSRITPMTLVSQVFNQFAVALVKTSIALMLVRLQQAHSWKVFLWSLIAVQLVVAVFTTAMHTTRCIPIEAMWNFSITTKRCWSPEAFKITMTVASSVVVATDLVYALMPLTFLHHIRRSVLHRVVIALLMSLGLLASAASIVKTVYVNNTGPESDQAANGITVAMWASVEVQVGIIAACIPTLRADFMRVLAKLGIYKEDLSRRNYKSDFSAQLPGHTSRNGDKGGSVLVSTMGTRKGATMLSSPGKASGESLGERSEEGILPYGRDGTKGFEMLDIKGVAR